MFILIPGTFCAGIQYDDPVKLGIGARPIGMGKAFVAVADDANAIFMNPAGLSTLKGWDIASMSTSFMDTYQYMVLGGAYPVNGATYGFGYVSSRVGQIPVSGGGTTDFENTVLILSYATYAGEYLSGWLGEEEDVHVGANFKLFSKGFSGATSAHGTGFNADFGMLYTPSGSEWITYGLNIQNGIPAWLGGGIGGGIAAEEIPMLAKIGAAFKVNRDILVAVDKDMYFGRAVPWPTHIGAEWQVDKNFVLRGGLDQSIGGNTGMLATNPSLGIGLMLNGFRVDMAYLVDFEAIGSASNYFSFSFRERTEPEKKKVKKVKKVEKAPPKKIIVTAKPVISKVLMTSPKDRSYTFDKRVRIQGTVDPDVSLLTLAGKKIRLTGDLKFNSYGDLRVGKNIFKFEIKDLRNKQQKFDRRVVRLYIPQGMARKDIEKKTLDYKISATLLSDYIAKEYRYNEKLTRSRLAVIISKAERLKLPVLFEKVANDISRKHWAARDIKAVLDTGAMTLYKNNTFRPNYFVTRSELVRTISKATNIPTDKLSGFLASDELDKEATMGDVISVMYNTNLLKEDINDYLAFLGITREEVKAELKPEAPEEEVDELAVDKPADKEVTFNSFTGVSGRVNVAKVEKVDVSGKTVTLKKGRFNDKVELKLGKNRVVVDARLKGGGMSSLKMRILRIELPVGAIFEDRTKLEAKPAEYKAAMQVMADIAGRYRISERIRRENFCDVIVKAKGLAVPEVKEDIATDVLKNYPLARPIAAVLRTGALRVSADSKFKPRDHMDRSELLEAVAVLQGVDLAAASQFFGGEVDLSEPATMADVIQLCWKSGIFKDRIDKLLAWDTY
ncbi:S-layer homology domain-containing protein [Candidatus Margulisiibacteriota bacterium]